MRILEVPSIVEVVRHAADIASENLIHEMQSRVTPCASKKCARQRFCQFSGDNHA
ncbi:hypothetical protein D8I24_0532 (plasmid) [Cupriavidus necator H850]|nr:hypothetical protein D8I24_0532 [Cupriavidus necator H850]